VSEWFESWFGEEYVALYPHRDLEEGEQAIELIDRHLFSPVSHALDLACGAGRHARSLSERWPTVGLDLSAVLLRLAVDEARDAEFVRGDMRVLPFKRASFELVVNLFTSFGYFADDESHLQVVREVARVTSPGGTFVLDFLNTDQLRDTLVPYDETEIGGQIVEQRREISDDGRFVTKRICIRGTSREFIERVRLFERDDLCRLMEASGFTVADIFGNYDESPPAPDAPRVILFGRRR